MADRHLTTIKSAIERAQRCLQDKDSCPNIALSLVRQAVDVNAMLTDGHAIPAEESGGIQRALSALENGLKEEIQMQSRESASDFAFRAGTIRTGFINAPVIFPLPPPPLQGWAGTNFPKIKALLETLHCGTIELL